jgi:dTDP-4-dehydrorhamnose reductase
MTQADYLILGANGLIGQQFVKILEGNNTSFVGTGNSREGKNLVKLDILDDETVRSLLDQVSPSVVLDCVGLAGGVDFCERNSELGRKFYVDSTRTLVEWCKKKGSALFFISTDCVFDGTNPPFSENDEPNPLNFYGKFKLESENFIKKNLKEYVIARTTFVFGWDPFTLTPNFLMQLYRGLQENHEIKVPSFLFGTPTLARDLAATVFLLLSAGKYGLYHIVGKSYMNRYEWALKFCNRLGFDMSRILEDRFPGRDMVPRPFHSHLNTEKLDRAVDYAMSDVDRGLEIFVNEMKRC